MTSDGEGYALTCNGAHRANKLAKTSLWVDVPVPNLKQGSHYQYHGGVVALKLQ